MNDQNIFLRGDEIDILCTLINSEIRHLANMRLELREKGIDCGGMSNRIDKLNAIRYALTR